MSSKNLVSVIIPTYKRPDTLKRCIDSVLSQTYKNVEVIVVDDNDPATEYRKDTERMMSLYSDNERVRYIQHDRNRNGSAARNTGFRASKGNYIMFLDDDDEFFPNKVQTQIDCLKNRDETWGVCYSEYIRVNASGKIIAVCGEEREGNMLKDELARNFFVHAGSNLMLRRNVVEEVNGFDESFNRNQDIEFLVRVLKKYKIAHVKYKGLIVHVEEDTSKRSSINVIDLTNQYIEKFKNEIDELQTEEQKKVYLLLNLQKFRYCLIVKKSCRMAISILLKHSIGPLVTIKYLIYLLHRRFSKKAYGFQE